MLLRVIGQKPLEDIYKYLCSEAVVISIVSSTAGSTPAKISTTEYIDDILFLKFDDLSDITNPELIARGYKFFNEELADAILSFANKHKNKLIICQCEAGISRSSAVAAALAKIHNNNDNIYFKNYVPNTLVYSTIIKRYQEKFK